MGLNLILGIGGGENVTDGGDATELDLVGCLVQRGTLYCKGRQEGNRRGESWPVGGRGSRTSCKELWEGK